MINTINPLGGIEGMDWKSGAQKASIWLLMTFLGEGVCFAVVKYTQDRIEINWSQMRVRYHGQASGSSLTGENYQTTAERALQEGLSYLVQTFPATIAKLDGSSSADEVRQIAHRIASSSYIAQTTYFASGAVRVDLESNLARALAGGEGSFRKEKAEELATTHTAIVIQLNQVISPTASYEVVDEASGEVLFEKADVAREEYEKNLMGRWFVDNRAREFRAYTGGQPVTITAKVSGSGKLSVSQQEWNEIVQLNPGLLESAKVAIVTPNK